jgi:tetratricopeptide (TPR) repeat protein
VSRTHAPDPLGRALQLLAVGRLDQAERMLRDAVGIDPDDPVAHATLALVLADLDRDEEAERSARAAIALDPGLDIAYTALARALAGRQRFDEAIVAARDAIRLDPSDSLNHELVAACQLAQGEWSEARATAEAALALDPDSSVAHGLRAHALAMAGDDEREWQAAAGAALKAEPGSSAAHALAAHAHLLRGGERRAVEGFEEALRLDPESKYAQWGLAEALKAEHPLFRPFFRFYMWQARLSRGARIALIVVPLIAVRGLRLDDGNPVVLAVLVAWFAFVALTWLATPLANLALRLSPRGRAILPAEQRRSSSFFAGLIGAFLIAVILGLGVNSIFFVVVLALAFVALAVGSAHALAPGRRRVVYIVVAAAVVAAFLGAAIIAAGVNWGSILLIASMLTGAALIWVVRLA